MGNRAVITTETNWKEGGVGIYLHWNGGRDSVEAFLEYCKLKGYRDPERDTYGMARLIQVIGNFFGGSLSLGVDTLWHSDCDNGDNGVYIIGEGWKITGRYYHHGEQNEYDLQEMLLEIDEAQPVNEQLGKNYLMADEVNRDMLKYEDWVYLQEYSGEIKPYKIIGFGEDVMVNGHEVKGIPYVARYGSNEDYTKNINNYLLDDSYRIYRGEMEVRHEN